MVSRQVARGVPHQCILLVTDFLSLLALQEKHLVASLDVLSLEEFFI